MKHLLVFRKEVFEAEQNISELRLLRREKIFGKSRRQAVSQPWLSSCCERGV